MCSTSWAGKESIEIDRLFRTPAPILDHARERPTLASLSGLVDLIQKTDQLRQRDFSTTRWSQDGGDLTLIDPTFERWVADAKKTRGVGRPDRRTDLPFEEFSDVGDIVSQRSVSPAFDPPEPTDVV